MAIPNSKTTLKSWCKRRLGYPVIDINVDDDQIDDRIDEALQYFYTFQYNGMQRVYLKHKVTQADMDRSEVDETYSATDSNAVTSTLASNGSVTDPTITLVDATDFPITGTITIAADGTNAAETLTVTAKTGNVLTVSAATIAHLINTTVTSVDTMTWEKDQGYLAVSYTHLTLPTILLV